MLKRVLFSHSIVHLWENNLNGPSIPCKVDNLRLQIIGCPEELDQLLADGIDLSWYEMSIQQCKERLGKGAIQFCALVDGDVAHISWAGMTKRSHGDFYSFHIDYRHEASVGGTMTAPRHKRKGIYTYVYSQIFQYLGEKGRARGVFETATDNIPVQRAQAKLGSTIRSQGHHLRLLLLFNFRWSRPYVA